MATQGFSLDCMWSIAQPLKRLLVPTLALASTLGTLGALSWTAASPALALNEYCHVTQEAALAKEELRKAAFSGDSNAQEQYQAMVQSHAAAMQDCRRRNLASTASNLAAALSLRFAAGHFRSCYGSGVNLGYNQVYVEVFYGGQVLAAKGR
jgi:hypothetical protein